MKRSETIIIGIAVALGLALRMTDIGFPDVLTDEAQFGLGSSAAHPPFGMFLMKVMMMLFGMNILALRSLSILLGIGCVVLIYFMTREKFSKQTALYAACIASLFPSAILFSRLAFLTMPQLFFWLLLILAFLRAKKDPSGLMLLFLFLASVGATFIKFQGLVVLGLLLLGRIIDVRKKWWEDSIVHVLVLSLLPIALYDITHPGVMASVLLYGGSNDMPEFSERFGLLFSTWWSVLSLAVILLPLSLFAFRKIGWELQIVSVWVLLQGFLFGASHEYYVADLLVFAIPCGVMFASVSKSIRLPGVVALCVLAFILLGPRSITLSRYTADPYKELGYWNTHAEAINNALRDLPDVVVLGDAGHQIRWYLAPTVLVGKDMDLSARRGAFLLLDPSIETPFEDGQEVYDDEQVRVILR